MDEDEDASMMSVDDISSSTDPLLETAATPASRSVTPAIPARQPASARRGSRRNQQPTPRTQRVQALRESTPRKRMFELDVGDARSPQRLLVTVEAESSRVTSRSSVSRRLFQHSTPTARSIRERERTTSVTVPLRGVEGDDDDEITRLGELVTPRPRGRPPRTATPGTALRSETPKTTTRPMRPATPGFQLREARSSSKDVLDSDVTIDFSKLGFTPGTKRRISLTPGPSSRAPKRRKGVSSPVRQPSLLGPGSARRKRGRPRKESIAHDQFSALIDRDLTALKEDDSDHEPVPEAGSSRDQQDRNRDRDQEQEHIRRERIFQRVPSNVILGNTGVGAPSSDAPRPDESEGDLWLDNSFNPPQDTPAARRWNGAPRAQSSRVEQLRPEPARRETPQLESELSHGDEYVEFADFGGGESHSDIESGLEDDNATPRDTPVQPTETRLPGEEFTMIDPYSLLSMQQNSSYVEEQGHGGAQNKDTRDGDTTSFYISKTIGSLRISQQESDERSSHIRTIDYSVNPNWTTTPRAPVPSYDPLYRYSTGDNRGEAEVVEEEEEEGDAHERSESLERHQNRPYSGAEQDSEREEQDRNSHRDSQRDRELESELALEPGSDAGSEPKGASRSERGKEAEPQHEPALEPEEEPEESDIWFRKEPRRRQQRELRKGKTHEPEPEPEPEPASEFNTWVRAEQRQEHQYRTQLESSLLHQRQANRTSRLERGRELELEQIAGNTPDFEPLPEQRSESPQEPERFEPVSEPHLEEKQEQEQELEDNLEYERLQESEAEARQEQAQQPNSRRVKSPHQQKARSLERQLDVHVRGDVGVDSSNRSVDYDQFETQESSVLYHGHLRRESRGALPPEPSSPLFRKSQTDVQQQTTKTSIQPSVERLSSTPSPVPPEPRDYDFQDDFGTHANVEADNDDAELNDDEQRQPTESTEPTPDDEMPSSPPTGSFSRHEQQRPEPPLRRVRSNSNETPADRLTSLAPPGLPALNPQNLMPPPDSQNRPALSPIIRAGEALQQVTSDPPSPPGMGSFLRSPFRGVPEVKDSRSPSPSASRASQPQPQSQPQAQPQSQPLPQAQFENARNQPERSGFGLFGSIKNLVAQGAQVLSPRNASRQASINTGESSRQASATAGATSSMDIAMDDPFGPDPPGSSRGSTGRNSLFGSRMSKRGSDSQDASGTASASVSFEKQSQASASLERQSRASSSSDRQTHGYNGFGTQFEDNAGFVRHSQVNAGSGSLHQVFGEPYAQGVAGFGSQRQIFGEPYAQGTITDFERSAQADANFGGRSQANTSFDRQADASTSFGRSQVQASSSHAIKQLSVTTKFDRQRQENTNFGHTQAESGTTHDRQAQSETSFASQRQASTNSSTRQPQANTTFGSTKKAASSFSEREREREQHGHQHEHEAMDWQAEESSHSHEINVTRDRSASASLGFHDSSSHHDSSGERARTSTREENSTRRSGSVREDHDSREPSQPEPEPEARRDYKEFIEVETVTEEREEQRIWGSYGGDARARSSFKENSSNSHSGRRHGRPENSTLRRSVGEEREREREPKARFRESVEVETVTEEREEERIYGEGDAKSSSFRESSHSSRRHGHGWDGHRHGSSRHRSSEERETTREERGRSDARERGKREVTEEIVEEVREEEYEHGSEHYHSGGRHSSGREEVESYRHGSSRSDRSDRGKASSSRQRSKERETREDRERREQGAREVTEEITEEVREEYEHESEHYRWGGHGEESRRHGSSHSNRSDRGKASSSSSSGGHGHRQRSSGEREAREVREVTEEIVEEERHEYEEERGGRRSSHVEESHRHWSRGPRGSQSSRASDSRHDDHTRGLKERDAREVTEAEDERHEYGEERKGQHSRFVEESSQRQESQSNRGGDSRRHGYQRSSAEPKRREADEARDDFAEEGQEHRTSRGSQRSRQRELLLGRGKTSLRDDQLRGSGESQATEVERAHHESFSEGEGYDMTHVEESHHREESPLEHRRDEHEHEYEQDHRMDYMEEEEEGHHQAQQGEQAIEHHEEEEEEEEDLFLLEAMRSSPAVKAKSTLKENDPASFLPSTHQPQPSSRWHSNKSQMVRDQLNKAADKSDELEEFSLLHSSRAKKFRPALKPVPNKKANLSSFFSSPAPIPEISLQGPEGNASLQSGPEVLDRQSQANGKVSSGSGALSERSQHLSTGQEAERKLGTTPIGRVPSSQRLSVPVSQKPFQPSPLGTAPVLSGQSSRPLQPAQRVLRHSSSIIGSSSPPQSGSIYTPVPQKQNFTPVRREPGAKLPLFERGGGTKTSTATTLPLKDNDSGSGTTPNSITDKPKQLLFGLKESISKLFSDPPAKSVEYGPENEDEEEQEPEEDMDDYDEIVELEEEQSSTEENFEPPPLRSLPDKNSSPVKSALRPPTKGHTPGRAVQFANSVRQSPTPRRNADVEQRRPVFGGRSTPVIITSSPSTHTESSPVPSPAGSERIQENTPGRYEEDYQDEEQHKLDDAADTDMDMDMNMDDDIEWYEHSPAPAPAVQAPGPAPAFPRPLSPGRGRQRQQQQQQESQPQQQQPQVAAAPRQPPAAQPPLIKPTSTLENSPVIRSGVSLFGYSRRKSLPPPIPPSNRNIVTPLQPLYPSLPPVSSFGQQQQQQQQSSQPSTSALTSTSQHHNGQASTGVSTTGTSTTATTTTSHSHDHQQEQQLPPPTHLWSTSHWDILSSVIHAHRALQSQSKGKGKQRASTHLYYPHSPTLSSFLHQTYRPSPQQTTYDPVTRLPIDESVVIEQWHLDVVYEFREMFRRAWGTDELYGGVFAMDEQEKGGWSEGELVRRVYAFLVGERRRREGRVDRGRRRGRGVVC
ncbi:uncharacterized protein B0T23DRAFT_360678 [Neurospora hispaniola]|uniref:Uncharacterized protein n=1 Tax=Neurospora hispaniola TaxID=588809 RepID=A0AAJ0I633_9PEZI|nr:hypothetical protein B0T23DRAFT_360678 [Neurospora hispaniola]